MRRIKLHLLYLGQLYAKHNIVTTKSAFKEAPIKRINAKPLGSFPGQPVNEDDESAFRERQPGRVLLCPLTSSSLLQKEYYLPAPKCPCRLQRKHDKISNF